MDQFLTTSVFTVQNTSYCDLYVHLHCSMKQEISLYIKNAHNPKCSNAVGDPHTIVWFVQECVETKLYCLPTFLFLLIVTADYKALSLCTRKKSGEDVKLGGQGKGVEACLFCTAIRVS